jgi:hypothetical protein
MAPRAARRIGPLLLRGTLGSRAANARLASVVPSGGVATLYLFQSSYWSVTADIAGRQSRCRFRLYEYRGTAGRGINGFVDAGDRHTP